jgi:4-hydroxy-tetrahydrodipicolinate reductase
MDQSSAQADQRSQTSVSKGLNMTIALSVLGATGKMGRRILQLAYKDPYFHIVGLTPESLASLNDSKEQITLSSDPQSVLANCDVAIDFTSPEAARDHLEAAVLNKKALVIGTTGHPPEGKKAIEEAARTIPILFSPNFSFGIALCLEAVARLGKALFGACTIDIVETHHVSKKDRPSGTALAFANAIGNGKAVLENDSAQPREKEEIVIHSVRSGEVVGEHILIFECGHERIELKHTAHSRDAFAQGALMGAKFLAKQPPGLYSLKDLFKDG